ncbi:MAG: mannose-6-phosphate isomerase [Chlorobi bacterium]|nr:mannose-6-phosphate isomerase [Chlorobiota bacterium]
MFYPLKFRPVFKEKVWGGSGLRDYLNKPCYGDKTGESWEISDLPESESVVSEGIFSGLTLSDLIKRYKSDFTGSKVYEKFGNEFPLLIKFIDAADDLSVQVHPDDYTAKRKHGKSGKHELWYVIKADEDAELISGLREDVSEDMFRRLLAENRLETVLNTVRVSSGDVFYIPAGRIHALKKGVLLAEIQQPSDVTYRLYDWNRKGLDGKPRSLHIEEALDVADLSACDTGKLNCNSEKNIFVGCLSSQYFTVNSLRFDRITERDYSDIDSFVIYICIGGTFKLYYSDNDFVTVTSGETILLPAVLKHIRLVPEVESSLLEVFV